MLPGITSAEPLAPSETTPASTDPSVCLPGTASVFTASTIVLPFREAVSRLILDYLNYFSGTTVASTSLTTSPFGMSYFFTTHATTAVDI